MAPGEGTFATISESEIRELIKFNIKSTLLTCPGERRDDLDFGVCCKKYLFDFFSSSETESLQSEILNQLNEYVPYCLIERIDIQAPIESPNSLKISIQYEITDLNKKDIFELLLSS